jgi:hypothetical protein
MIRSAVVSKKLRPVLETPTPRFGTNRSMTNYDNLELETVVKKPIIGIDNHGATHHFDQVRRTIYVIFDAEIEYTESLDSRHLSEWMAYQRGWDDLRYTERSWVEQLAVLMSGL